MPRLAALALALLPLAAAAAGPARVALTTRAAWPRPTDTPEAFDLASRAEILAFAGAWAELDQAGDEALGGFLKLKDLDDEGLARWRAGARRALLANYVRARASCRPEALLCGGSGPATWDDLALGAARNLATLPAEFAAWRTEAARFHADYLFEQLRLAALFRKVTSEILPLDASEMFGTDFPDRSFLLTFDDGPDPVETAKLRELLRAHGSNGVFFALGSALHAKPRTQDEVRALYAGQCLASHGMEHKPHTTWALAATTLAKLDAELAGELPGGQDRLRLFRPPYGQRTPELVRSLLGAGVRTMLWNIDSQDWQASVTPELAAGRVTTLALLWRRGIVLFHDVHPKAAVALPALWRSLDGAGVTWLDCRKPPVAADAAKP